MVVLMDYVNEERENKIKLIDTSMFLYKNPFSLLCKLTGKKKSQAQYIHFSFLRKFEFDCCFMQLWTN